MIKHGILKKSLSLALVILLGASTLTACTSEGALKKNEDLLSSVEVSSAVPKYNFTEEDVTPEGYDTYSEKLTEFSLNLLRTSYKGENTLLPTLSTHQNLALILNGTSGKTATELKKAISQNMDLQTLNTCNHYLQSRVSYFNTEEEGYFAESALWMDDLFDVKTAFTQSAKNYYSCTLARLELNTEDAWGKINKNTELKTNNCFEQIIDVPLKGQVIFGESVATIKDTWAVPYTADRITQATFKGTSGDTTATFMTSNEKYVETELGEGFVKSLKNTPVKFAVITPKESSSVEELLNSLNYNRMKTMLLESDPTAFCTASFPEFKVAENTCPDQLLKSMGIEEIYSEDANFSSLTNGDGAKVTSTLMASYLDVTAQGITTSSELETQGDTLKETERKLIFDKPFIYIFFDNESAAPIFMGVVSNI